MIAPRRTGFREGGTPLALRREIPGPVQFTMYDLRFTILRFTLSS